MSLIGQKRRNNKHVLTKLQFNLSHVDEHYREAAKQRPTLALKTTECDRLRPAGDGHRLVLLLLLSDKPSTNQSETIDQCAASRRTSSLVRQAPTCARCHRATEKSQGQQGPHWYCAPLLPSRCRAPPPAERGCRQRGRPNIGCADSSSTPPTWLWYAS